MFCLNVGANKSRGIIIYVNDKLPCVELNFELDFSEYIFVQIKDSNFKTLTIGAVYRSPSSGSENNNNLLKLIDTAKRMLPEKLLLVGDFNLGNINWSNWTTNATAGSIEGRFLYCLKNNLLLQHVSFPTRARGSQVPHTLDLIITNSDFIYEVENLSPLGKSDHSVIHCVCHFHSDFHQVVCRNYNKGDYDTMRQLVYATMYTDKPNIADVNSNWVSFKNTVQEAVENCIPLADTKWKKKETWQNPLPSNTRKFVRKKHRLWTREQKAQNLKWSIKILETW